MVTSPLLSFLLCACPGAPIIYDAPILTFSAPSARAPLAYYKIILFLCRTVKLAWHHYRISMAPFMLEPWEQFIYILLILLVAYGFGHAVMRTIDLARPMLAAKLNGWAPALNNHVNSL